MQNKHILIVDDHSLFRTGLKMILTQIGNARGISEADSVKEALDFCESGVDVVLLDIHMPGINGIDGIKPLRDRFGSVPIIMLSANNDHAAMVQAKEGKPNKLIARELEMSENTVRVHVSAILATLGASNRTEAILIAQREGITA